MKEENLDNQAKDKLREELEFRYMNLNMEIDNCQGCMEGLNEAFAELKVLKDTIKYLGIDLDQEGQYKRILDNWYKKVLNSSDKLEDM